MAAIEPSLPRPAETLPLAVLPEIDATLEKALNIFALQTSFTVSSCRLPDMPIVYASPGFYELTGYTCKEVIGRNCRFLQGAGTSRQAVLEVRDSIQEDRGCTVCLLNYKKDGKPFWNQLCLAPVSDQFGVAYYLGIQSNVTGVVLAYRSQQFQSPSAIPGPHGGVHSFKGCPEIIERELQKAAELGNTIKRWHSERLSSSGSGSLDHGPISCALLPASLLTPLYKLHQSFVLADPKLPDIPIVHASDGFIKLTGRPRDQVIGHNCRFLQGSRTCTEEVRKVRNAIAEEKPVTVKLLNYRHDGTPFWNSLHIAPIRNAGGEIVFYIGVQLDVTLKKGGSCSEAVREFEDLRVGGGTGRAGGQQADWRASRECAQDAGEEVPQASAEEEQQAKQKQRSVVGAVRVVCRSLSTKSGLRRSQEHQHQPCCPLPLPPAPSPLRP